MTQITWAQAQQEADNPELRNPELWAECFAEAEGDENKAKARYMCRVVDASTPPPTTGFCPNCSATCPLDASNCKQCGAVFEHGGWQPVLTQPSGANTSNAPPPAADTPKKGGIWKWVLGVPVAAFLALMVIGALSGPDEKADARNAISLCWKEQERKSLDPGTARFVAGACERMEENFRQKYRVNP